MAKMNKKKLEGILKAYEGGSRLVGSVLPILSKESLEGHVKYIIKENPEIRRYLEKSPDHLQTLMEAVKDVYGKHSKYITGAKGIDSWDRMTSSLGLIGESVSALGGPAIALSKGVEEAIELAPKILYTPLYAAGTGDYGAIPYFMGVEALSLVPFVGQFVDLQNLYLERARKTFRKEASKEFMKRLDEGILQFPNNPEYARVEERKRKFENAA